MNKEISTESSLWPLLPFITCSWNHLGFLPRGSSAAEVPRALKLCLNLAFY